MMLKLFIGVLILLCAGCVVVPPPGGPPYPAPPHPWFIIEHTPENGTIETVKSSSYGYIETTN
ncbi:MAG: hypothetical protein L3V56_12875 [Candidatus Magnetoovum sp. WYHC-5]|nr:hypothetical protein [Candidatus Magnetoovum sp. WYHC-5]